MVHRRPGEHGFVGISTIPGRLLLLLLLLYCARETTPNLALDLIVRSWWVLVQRSLHGAWVLVSELTWNFRGLRNFDTFIGQTSRFVNRVLTMRYVSLGCKRRKLPITVGAINTAIRC